MLLEQIIYLLPNTFLNVLLIYLSRLFKRCLESNPFSIVLNNALIAITFKSIRGSKIITVR